MRWTIMFAAVAAALALFAVHGDGVARAQAAQCAQASSPSEQTACARLQRLQESAGDWRTRGHQSRSDYAYYDERRTRCNGDVACLTDEYQTEIAELQVASGSTTPAPAATPPSTNLALAGAPATASAHGSNDLRGMMDQVVLADSQGWMFNRYDQGSMNNVRVLNRSANHRSMVVYGDYTYNGGSQGWVRAHVDDGAFTCVEYWDFQGRCRPVGSHSYAYDILAGLAVAALTSSGGSGSRGSSSAANTNGSNNPNNWRPQPNSQPDEPPPPEPMTPIGGDNGLYGCASPPCM